MKETDLKELVERDPFRPFRLRLSNGRTYDVLHRRNMGAPADYHVLVVFHGNEVVLIDPEHISEVSNVTPAPPSDIPPR